MKLHIDIETYSSVDISSSGVYKYCESPDFEILMVAYAFNQEPIQVIDLAQGERLPKRFLSALSESSVKKYAHNANFERRCFAAIGLWVPVNQWVCTAVHAAYCGLPLSLEMVSKVLDLGDKGKSNTCKALIRYFSTPCKPTKANGQRARNLPEHDLEKWNGFKAYCVQDVEAERAIENRLVDYPLPESERKLYQLDQQINDRGIFIDREMARNAYRIDREQTKILTAEAKKLTGLDNPNSPGQLKQFIGAQTGKAIASLSKSEIPNLIEESDNELVGEVLALRQKMAKSSVKKYTAMLNCVCNDGRAHGLFQFYGANRTGRWAGRLIQLQNLPQNHLGELDLARQFVKAGDLGNLSLLYDDVADTLSQLIRTAFVAERGKTFAVADFSAIEARVIAWLAQESWRLDVFKSHGKIYEASASMMFGVPIEEVTKGSDLRQKGKVAELALGYQGSVGALKTMGGERMGLSESEMKEIVDKWRKANPAIVQLWKDLEGCAKEAIRSRKPVKSSHGGLVFKADKKVLTITLPSGRKLFYCDPILKPKHVKLDNGESWQTESIRYMGMDQVKKQWVQLDTYGGKLAENIVQAIARDLLASAMVLLDLNMFKIVMHVHDEVVCEIDNNSADEQLQQMCELMSKPVSWAPGLPLAADGYLTTYYKKD